MNRDKEIVSLIVPCYNEANILLEFMKKTQSVLESLFCDYEIIFINDGSIDNTLNVLLDLKKQYKFIKIINLSRNFGKEAALTAGLNYTKGDMIIPIDADLQHPPSVIVDLITKYKEGYEVVLAKRLSRTGESKLKKVSAHLFYTFYNKISDIPIIEDVGDFRLMSRKVVNAITTLPENQRFMKGIFSWVGFKTGIIEYYQEDRFAGTSNFGGMKLWKFALDGITSFSTMPLKIWTYIGIIISISAFLLLSDILITTYLYGTDLPGYVSTIAVVLFLGGIQLIGIGLLGEYLGRTYLETKHRPTYIVEGEY